MDTQQRKKPRGEGRKSCKTAEIWKDDLVELAAAAGRTSGTVTRPKVSFDQPIRGRGESEKNLAATLFQTKVLSVDNEFLQTDFGKSHRDTTRHFNVHFHLISLFSH